MKSRNENEIAIGWQVEKFSREGKNLKALAEYLKPPRILTPDQGAKAMRGMIARMKARKEASDGNR